MSEKKVKVNFTNEFKGQLIGPKGTVNVGMEEGSLEPYDMLLGALASCLYATFLDIAKKKRIGFKSATIEVTGEKREEVPTTLKWVNVNVIIHDSEKEKGLTKAVELATVYCSIYQTLAKVADMSWEVHFIYSA